MTLATKTLRHKGNKKKIMVKNVKLFCVFVILWFIVSVS